MASIIDKTKAALGMNTQNQVTLLDHQVGSTGYGLMGLTWRANPPPQDQAFSAMKEALAHGATFWNGGEIYGNATRNSLHLLREYFDKYPADEKKVVISIKGGCEPNTLVPNGSEENTRRSIQECIDVLGSKKLDLWEAARVDGNVPIEIPMRVAKRFVEAGKLGGVSLSECSAETIRRASKEITVSAVEVEFSLWSTEILENGVAATCAELGIPIVAYSPLGRGFLTGQVKSREDVPEHLRNMIPRFSEENFGKNLELVHGVEKIAQRKGCTSGQVAISWIKAKSGKDGLPTIIPIPGATTAERVRENMVTVELSENDVKEIDSLLATVPIYGGRYGGQQAAHMFGDSPELKE